MGRLTALRRIAGERGSATIEMVILAPAFMMLVGLLIMGGRLAIANQSVQSAAGAAARAASQERGQDAEDSGLAAAEQLLGEQKTDCETVAVDLDLSGKETDPGVTGQMVTATVSCDVKLSGLGLPGVGDSYTVKASASSPIDAYRER